MMTYYTIIIFLFAIVVLASAVAFNYYWKLRLLQNKLLAVASTEFFDGVDKLLETPDDIPESMLDLLEVLSKSIDHKSAPRVFYRSVKLSRLSDDVHINPEARNSFISEVNEMRPELRKIFGETTAAWMNFVSSRSVFFGFLTYLELRRHAADEKRSGVEAIQDSLELVPRATRSMFT